MKLRWGQLRTALCIERGGNQSSQVADIMYNCRRNTRKTTTTGLVLLQGGLKARRQEETEFMPGRLCCPHNTLSALLEALLTAWHAFPACSTKPLMVRNQHA